MSGVALGALAEITGERFVRKRCAKPHRKRRDHAASFQPRSGLEGANPSGIAQLSIASEISWAEIFFALRFSAIRSASLTMLQAVPTAPPLAANSADGICPEPRLALAFTSPSSTIFWSRRSKNTDA